MTSHLRTIEENISGSGLAIGSPHLRRALEIQGDDFSVLSGSWARKLFFVLGGDLETAPRGSWMKKLAYLLGFESYPGSWDAKVAAAIVDGGGVMLATFDSTEITFDNDNLTMDQDV